MSTLPPLLAHVPQSLLDGFDQSSAGMFLIDAAGRVVWINDAYRQFLPALGLGREDEFVGHPVVEVVPNTRMLDVLKSGQPVLMDLLINKAGAFMVSRFPIRDSASEVIGALGVVLIHDPQQHMQPLLQKLSALQHELDEAKAALRAQTHPSGSRQARHCLADFIGHSAQALAIKRDARRAARSSSPVLILGETGTGKENLAHAIHLASDRMDKPFVSLNVAAIPESLIESEMLGVAPGAYTGADKKGRMGKFMVAHQGTLFLDEVADMPLAMQSKLLRCLEDGEIEALGSNRIEKVDVRIIAATSRPLHEWVKSGRFRSDLFYRLHVLPLNVPPLRSRKEDIAALAEAWFDHATHRIPEAPLEMDPAALKVLMEHHWPGNVRELHNILEQAMLRAEGGIIGTELIRSLLPDASEETPAIALPAPPATPAPPPASTAAWPKGLSLRDQLAPFERQLIEQALFQCQGNRHAAARMLGISKVTLYQRMHQYGWMTLPEGSD